MAPLAGITLLTATAGNHGRAVARVARWLDLPCLVLVPSSLNAPAFEAIRSEGAQVRAVDGSYDDAVTQAAALAAADGGYVLIQDTGWPRYQQVPAWIVEGYDTLFREVDDALRPSGRQPGLVVVPAGVGSLLAAAIGHYHAPGRPSVPAILSVEPEGAACVLASVRAGHPVSVQTKDYVTAMAGLNAGTVSAAAWPSIRAGLDAAAAVSDEAATRAQGELHRMGVRAGPCGAATLAAARVVLTGVARDRVLETLGLTGDSTVVLISTDGAADAVDVAS